MPWFRPSDPGIEPLNNQGPPQHRLQAGLFLGSSRKSVERGLDFSEKVQIVSEAISSSLNLLDFIVDTFKYRGVDLKVRGCNDALHIAPEVLAEIYQGRDPAVSGSVNPVHNQSDCLSARSQTPEMSKFVSHEIAFEQRRIKEALQKYPLTRR